MKLIIFAKFFCFFFFFLFKIYLPHGLGLKAQVVLKSLQLTVNSNCYSKHHQLNHVVSQGFLESSCTHKIKCANFCWGKHTALVAKAGSVFVFDMPVIIWSMSVILRAILYMLKASLITRLGHGAKHTENCSCNTLECKC